MTDYKLMPEEATPEMLEAGEYALKAGCYVSGIYADMRAAAPAVQGEPVAWQRVDRPERIITVLSRRTWKEVEDGVEFRALYSTSQPAEQQPCPDGIREGAPYDDPAFESLCREYGIWGTAAAAQCAVFWGAGKRVAEQKPAPDVAGLESALKSMVSGYMRLLQSGYDRITDLGGDCDPVDVMERDDAYLREARAALAAHRKGGEA